MRLTERVAPNTVDVITSKRIRGVYQRQPGIWWIRWTDSDGRLHREKGGRKSAAKNLYIKRKNDAREGQKVPRNIRAKSVLFKVIADDALEYSKVHKGDAYNDEIRIPRLVEQFGTRQAASITHQEIDAYIDSISKAPATFNRWRALFSMIFREAIRNKKVTENPAKLVRPRKVDNIQTRFLTDKEEAKLTRIIAEKFPHHLQSFVVALHTGMRLSEQFTVEWSQVSLSRKNIHLLKTKNGSERDVPLNSMALQALKKLTPEVTPAEGPIFLTLRKEKATRKRARIKTSRTWFDDVRNASGLTDVTWHTLRHTFASRLVMAGVDLRTVQELMGHKTLQMTVRYSHLAPSHTLSAVERLARVKSSRATGTSTDTKTKGQSRKTGRVARNP